MENKTRANAWKIQNWIFHVVRRCPFVVANMRASCKRISTINCFFVWCASSAVINLWMGDASQMAQLCAAVVRVLLLLFICPRMSRAIFVFLSISSVHSLFGMLLSALDSTGNVSAVAVQLLLKMDEFITVLDEIYDLDQKWRLFFCLAPRHVQFVVRVDFGLSHFVRSRPSCQNKQRTIPSRM